MEQRLFSPQKSRRLSLRLTGAEVLRDGKMQRRSVAIQNGRVTKGPLPEVDLSGYFVLPGIVDLCGLGFQNRMTASDMSMQSALLATARDAAANGVTTARIAQGWGWVAEHSSPDVARTVLALIEHMRPSCLIDMRAVLLCDTHTTTTRDALLASVRRHGVDLVLFTDLLKRIELGKLDRGPLMEKAASVAPEKRDVPRHLCRLAEAFDLLGTVYGSLDDPDGETRETYSMLGAKLCARPENRKPAALAKAVGDPVILPASDILRSDQAALTTDLLRSGLCQALMSDHHYGDLARAVFKIVDDGRMSLPRAWALISQTPAEILRLPDRGHIDYGRRADLVVVHATTKMVEATIADGRIAYLSGGAAQRFLAAGSEVALAAE